MELEECIKDGFDDSLRDYIQSEEYKQRQDEIEEMISSFRSVLSVDQQLRFIKIIDAITSEEGKTALEAYTRGVVEGIALRKKYI